MNIEQLRKDFPILSTRINAYPLIYFDSAATMQKPQEVIDALVDFYTHYNANVHRAVYTLAERATQKYEEARANIAQYLHAKPDEIVFTKGTTEGINIIAHSFAARHLSAGDEILVTEQEHHSNLLPWQEVMRNHGIVLHVLSVHADGTLDLSMLDRLITKKTKLVALSHVSNVIGIENDIRTVIAHAHAQGANVVIDASQSVARYQLDVKQLDADFVVFSGHKMIGPTGVGVLYIHERLHERLRPHHVGGGMITQVSLRDCSWQQMPYLLEAGTPPIAAAIGLGAAVTYIQNNIDFSQLQQHEAQLCARLIDGLEMLPDVTIIGPKAQLKTHGHLVSFVIAGVHPHDVASYLDRYGIAVRAGHHCAQPLAQKLGISASLRISFYAYNTLQEVDFCLEMLQRLMNQQ